MSRNFDVIVLGSTGSVGKLVCEHLASHYQGKVKWAMAARNKSKLEQVRKDISEKYRGAQDVPLLIADAQDRPALNSIIKQSKVVLAMSGPFAILGTQVVESCIEHGTHYCDITGEVQWVRDMISQHHDEAARKGVKIVHCCGFDSIPSDLGTAFVVDHIKQTYGRPTKSVDNQFVDGKGGIGGGTIASLLGVFEQSRARLKQIADPYCLDPPDSARGPDKADFMGAEYSQATSKWTAPFIMAPINTRVVRRSNALLGHKYGKHFSYTERMQASNPLVAYAMSAVISLGGLLAYFNASRWLLRKVIPKPGTAPSRETMEAGSWKFQMVGRSEEVNSAPPRTVKATVRGRKDPGYIDTSRMALEAGLCLATQQKELQEAGMLQGGVLTPGSAMGMVLVKRLQAIGVEFQIQQEAGTSHDKHA